MRYVMALTVLVTAVLVQPAAARADPACEPAATVVAAPVPWPQRFLGLGRVHELTTGVGQVVGVVDSGVDSGVPQLAGHVTAGPNVTGGTGPSTQDCTGHGTFVAGLIAAQPAPGVGFVGVAPGAVVLAVRVYEPGGGGRAEDIARGIRAAVDAGARVINVSVSTNYPDEALRLAVADAHRRDVVVVAAADNQARTGNPVTYPASYPEVIGVGAVGQDGRRADFSEVGDFVDLVAPGVDVTSLGPRGAGHLHNTGTSFAAPFVAGTAALVRAAHPGLTADQVRHRLEVTADHPGAALPDPQVGWGAVDPYRAVAAVLPEESEGPTARPVAAVPPPEAVAAGPATGGSVWFAVSMAGLVAVAALAAVVVPRGRRRRWRPAGSSYGVSRGS